jgi:hypothetical protein
MAAEAIAAGANLFTKLIDIPVQLISERPIKLRELELDEKQERHRRLETIKKHALERELLDNENEKYWRERRIRETEDLKRQLERFKEDCLHPPDKYQDGKPKVETFLAGAEMALESIGRYEKEMRYKAVTDEPKVWKEIGTPLTKIQLTFR